MALEQSAAPEKMAEWPRRRAEMSSGHDIFGYAKAMIGHYGREARQMAVLRADARLAQGDRDDHELWLRVIIAIIELQDADARPHALE